MFGDDIGKAVDAVFRGFIIFGICTLIFGAYFIWDFAIPFVWWLIQVFCSGLEATR